MTRTPHRRRALAARLAAALGAALLATFGMQGTTAPADSAPPGTLAFTSTRVGNAQNVFTMPARGGNARRVTRDWGVDPAWSPSGGSIAFTTGGCCLHIELVRRNGSGAHRLTRERRLWEGWPSWSPSGRTIAFQRMARDSEIAVAGVRSHRVTILTSNRVDDAAPAFSPDGRWIAFARGSSKRANIWVMRASGSDQRQLTRSNAGDADPAWSPDGDTVAFSRLRSGWRYLYAVPAAGGEARRLTAHRGAQPAFSPDGGWLAFTGRVGNAHDDNGLELFVMRVDGTGIRRLTHNRSADFDPAWRPSA